MSSNRKGKNEKPIITEDEALLVTADEAKLPDLGLPTQWSVKTEKEHKNLLLDPQSKKLYEVDKYNNAVLIKQKKRSKKEAAEDKDKENDEDKDQAKTATNKDPTKLFIKSSKSANPMQGSSTPSAARFTLYQQEVAADRMLKDAREKILVLCFPHGDFIPITDMDADHLHPKADFRKRQIALIEFLNKNPEFAEKFMETPGMDDFFKLVTLDGQKKYLGTLYFYEKYFNDINNLWLLCHSCNLEKSNKETLEWLKGQPMFGEDFDAYIQDKLGKKQYGILIQSKEGEGLAILARQWYLERHKEYINNEMQTQDGIIFQLKKQNIRVDDLIGIAIKDEKEMNRAERYKTEQITRILLTSAVATMPGLRLQPSAEEKAHTSSESDGHIVMNKHEDSDEDDEAKITTKPSSDICLQAAAMTAKQLPDIIKKMNAENLEKLLALKASREKAILKINQFKSEIQELSPSTSSLNKFDRFEEKINNAASLTQINTLVIAAKDHTDKIIKQHAENLEKQKLETYKQQAIVKIKQYRNKIQRLSSSSTAPILDRFEEKVNNADNLQQVIDLLKKAQEYAIDKTKIFKKSLASAVEIETDGLKSASSSKDKKKDPTPPIPSRAVIITPTRKPLESASPSMRVAPGPSTPMKTPTASAPKATANSNVRLSSAMQTDTEVESKRSTAKPMLVDPKLANDSQAKLATKKDQRKRKHEKISTKSSPMPSSARPDTSSRFTLQDNRETSTSLSSRTTLPRKSDKERAPSMQDKESKKTATSYVVKDDEQKSSYIDDNARKKKRWKPDTAEIAKIKIQNLIQKIESHAKNPNKQCQKLYKEFEALVLKSHKHDPNIRRFSDLLANFLTISDNCKIAEKMDAEVQQIMRRATAVDIAPRFSDAALPTAVSKKDSKSESDANDDIEDDDVVEIPAPSRKTF
jgi:5-methylcytosine-specific restriction endonuclease McrA